MTGKLHSLTAAASVLLLVGCSGAPTDKASRQSPPAEQINAPAAAAGTQPAPASQARHGELLQEAVDALRETHNALAAIDRNTPDDAMAALERATGKLEIVLARTPDLALAPVDISFETHDLLSSVDAVEALRDRARSALDHGRLQEARRLIGDLASETDIDESQLPLATYPAALTRAAALLHQGKPREAKAALEMALGTIVVKRTVMPLPLVRAEAAVTQARGLGEKANRSAVENARLRALLQTARDQLRLGKALGYATDKDMKDLLAAVDEIDRKTSGQQHGAGLLDRIGALFRHAHGASQPKAS